MVAAAQMGLLVGNDMALIAGLHVIRKIDFGLDDPEQKRRMHILTLIDPALQAHGFTEPPAQPAIADGGIQKKQRSAGNPDRRENRNPYLQRIGACARCGGKGAADDRVYHAVQLRNACLDGGGLLQHDCRADGFYARDQTPCTFDRKWKNEPHRDNPPKQDAPPLGRSAQTQPQHQYRGDDPACGDTHIEDF